jgi:PIN domain nuclease of toxin-antitoxin system
MVLLDTCTLLWLVMEQSRLSDVAESVLREHAGMLHVSSVSAFELGQKHAAGKLEFPMPPAVWFAKACAAHGLVVVPLQPGHAFRASGLPLHHRDPFDRLLVGTAAEQGFSVLTPDPLIHRYAEARAHW